MAVNQGNFEKAMHAALQGPEVKKLKIEKHEFNVKPIKTQRVAGKLEVGGQISHHLSLRDDDQYRYRFTLVPGQQISIQDVDVDIDRSILSSVFKLGLDLLVKYLSEKLGDKLPDLPGQTTQALTTAGDQAATRVFEDSKRLLDGSWEGEANFMVVNIAARLGLGVVAQQRAKVDPMTFARGINTTRPVRPRPVPRPVPAPRDHRTQVP
jgi:hypothetical protein